MKVSSLLWSNVDHDGSSFEGPCSLDTRRPRLLCGSWTSTPWSLVEERPWHHGEIGSPVDWLNWNHAVSTSLASRTSMYLDSQYDDKPCWIEAMGNGAMNDEGI